MSRTTTVVVGAVSVFVSSLAAIVALAYIDMGRAESLAAPILGAAGTLLLGLLALDKVSKVDEKVDRVERHTTDLTNGLMDSKIRAAVADVVRDQYVDPGAQQLLAADRRRRDGAQSTTMPESPA